jgi:glycosyltransferase involved in cell wall biosynthesis
VKVLIVSGIWPPDVGGPASHAPEVARFLVARGHDVDVVITASGAPPSEAYPIHFTSRRIPVGLRHLHSLVLITRHARRADAVYSTGMFGRSGIGSAIARRPIVIKLTGDPAFERLRARGVVDGDVDEFQRSEGGLATRGLRYLRDAVMRRAAHVFTPSSYLRDLVVSWGVDPSHVSVMPNPAPDSRPSAPRDELRARFGIEGNTLVFAGRLTAQKSLALLLEALAQVDDISLVIAGEGDEKAAVVAEVSRLGLGRRVRLLGALPRDGVIDLFGAADATVLSSSWENFPHTVVESLAVGTPVISTRAGGVAEVVVDGHNGLLVPVGDPNALAAAIRRYFSDERLRASLRENASPSVDRYSTEHVLGAVVTRLEEAVR